MSEQISLAACAQVLGVSVATVRNWIKAGYLLSPSRAQVCLHSLETFQREKIGKDKLVQRANKLHKPTLLHATLTDRMGADIGSAYENSLAESHRNRDGIYYTPTWIVEDLFHVSTPDVSQLRFCDPCCGSGQFLMRALALGFRPEHIFGFDRDPLAVEMARTRFFEQTGIWNEQIRCADFLALSASGAAGQYEAIFTNPPWGAKLPFQVKQTLAAALGAGNSRDSSALFYFACLRALSERGRLGLLLPDAFFHVGAYEWARKSMLAYCIERLIDYAKPFKGLQTGAVGIVLSRQPKPSHHQIVCMDQGGSFSRLQTSFSTQVKSILNVSCRADEAEAIAHVFALPHLTLQGHATWGLGLVTGNNAQHLHHMPAPGLVPVYKGSDILPSGLKAPRHFIATDFSAFQQFAPRSLYQAPQKLIYKFISSRLCFFLDCEQRLILNSANCVCVTEDFPISMAMLAELFNSELMNWLFQKLFQTHKVLRSDLEVLPLFPQFLGTHFDEAAYVHALGLERVAIGYYRLRSG